MICSKVKYKDHQLAVTALHTIQSKGVKKKNTPCRVYQCPDCLQFHLTSDNLEWHLENRAEDIDLKYKEKWNKLT